MDSELEALQSIAKTLEDLAPDAQKRVITWVAARFVGASAPISHDPVAQTAKGLEIDFANGGSPFKDFPELFHAINPTDNAGRALAASYWLSTQNEGEAFASQGVNSLLKDIGYQVLNITDALSQCMREKPALVIQVRKGGSSKQARKLYKLTDAGRRKVQFMMSTNG